MTQLIAACPLPVYAHETSTNVQIDKFKSEKNQVIARFGVIMSVQYKIMCDWYMSRGRCQ